MTHYRPIEPRTTQDVTSTDETQQARGVVITGLASSDQGVNAVFSQPTVDLASMAPEQERNVDAFPSHILTLGHALTPGGRRDNLVVMPGQFFGDDDPTATTGIQRLYGQVDATVYYAPASAEALPPTISLSSATLSGGQVTFAVGVIDDAGTGPGSGTIARVAVMFHDVDGWHQLDLTRDAADATRWSGSAPAAGTRVEFLSQAVDGVGNSAVSTDKGRLFEALPAGAAPGTAAAPPTVTLSGTPAENGWFTGPVAVAATGDPATTYAVTVDGTPTTGTEASVTGDGVHVVEVEGSDGTHVQRTVAIDGTAPTVSVTGPPLLLQGRSYRPTVDCADATSGVASCPDAPIDTATTGPGQTLTIRGRDRAGNTATATASYEVIAADVCAPDMPDPVVPVGTAVAASMTAAGYVSEASLDWGDGTTTSVPAASGRLDHASHTYAAAGVYPLRCTVVDDAGVSSTRGDQYVVVYDAQGGFVTGGGWVTSPAGAYAPAPDASGKARFAFVSRYGKGATVPSGTTEFRLDAAGMRFASDTYDWLVVAGARAQFKGMGTINGAGDYGFLITAIDGDLNGGRGSDRFRIQIWDRASGGVLYDNQVGADDAADPTTTLGGGSIVIHKR